MANHKFCDNCEKKIPSSQVWDNEFFSKLALCNNCATDEYLEEKEQLIESLENVESGLEELEKAEAYAKKLVSAIDEFAKGNKSQDLSEFADIGDLGDLTLEEAEALLNSDVDFVREKNLQKERENQRANEKKLREQKDNLKNNKKNKKKEEKEKKRKLKVDFSAFSEEDAENFLVSEGVIKGKKNSVIDFELDDNDFGDFGDLDDLDGED